MKEIWFRMNCILHDIPENNMKMMVGIIDQDEKDDNVDAAFERHLVRQPLYFEIGKEN